MIAVRIIKGMDLSKDKIRGSAYECVVNGLGGFISLVDLCNREGTDTTQDRIRKTKLVLDHAADNSRPFVYCVTDGNPDNSLYLIDQTMASRIHTYATTLSLSRGEDGHDKNRETIRDWFHKISGAYASISDLERNLEGIDKKSIVESIEKGSVRKQQHSYHIGDVVTAIQNARGNYKMLARLRN